jgi:peptide chain release factor 1
LLVEGENIKKVFEKEIGGHQWHRIPPTEGHGRVHTSMVTVSVMDFDETKFEISNNDLEYSTTRGSGNGGQNRNKVESVVVVKHKPSGTTVRCETERSQWKNKQLALKILENKLKNSHEKTKKDISSSIKKEQHGTGERSDKIKTYVVKRDEIIDHVNNKRYKLSEWYKGKL